MASSDVEIVVTAAIDQAQASLSKLEQSFSSLKTVGEVALGFLAGREILRGFEDITSAASQLEDSTNRMDVALKLSGNYTDEASDHFKDFADTMEKTSIYSRGVVEDQIAVAQQFNVTNDQAEKLVRASEDLASVTHIDLDTAVQGLGKTLDGHLGRIGKQIPALQQFSKSQLEAGAALDYVATHFNGAAFAASQTFSGAMTRTQHAFEGFLSALGDMVIKNPYVIAAINGIANIFNLFEDTINKNRDAITRWINDGIVAILHSIPTLVSGLDLVNEAILKLTHGFNTIKGVVQTFVATFATVGQTEAGKQSILEAANEDILALQKSNEEAEKSYDARKKAIGELVNQTQIVVNGAIQQAKAYKNVTDTIETQTKAVIQLSQAQRQQFLSQGASNPFGVLFGSADIPKAATGFEKGLAVADGFMQGVSNGLKGTVSLISNAFGAIADSILPGIGGAVGQIVTVLAQGPDAMKAMIQQFLTSIPDILVNIAQAVPAIIQSLADNLPTFVQKLADAAPKIIEALELQMPAAATRLAANMPVVAVRFVTELVHNVPVMVKGFATEFLKIPAQFVDKLVNFLKDALSNLIPGLGGSGGDSSKKTGAAIGTSIFGPVGGVIGGFIGGLFNAIPSNSLSIPRSGASQLASAVAGNGSNSLSSQIAELTKASSGGSQNLSVNLTVGEKDLARVILNLNRQGFRTA